MIQLFILMYFTYTDSLEAIKYIFPSFYFELNLNIYPEFLRGIISHVNSAIFWQLKLFVY